MRYRASRSACRSASMSRSHRRYSGRRSRKGIAACGEGNNSKKGEASKRVALAPMATGVGVVVVELEGAQV